MTAPRLCVGMSTYDDFDGVWFTVQSLRLSHPEVLDRTSFLIVDNHPDGPVADSLRGLATRIPALRYLPFGGYQGTAVRDLVFREADEGVVCCLDSHVLVQPGALSALLRWFADRPDSLDLLQGPLLYDDLTVAGATHLAPEWGAGMYGRWGMDERGAKASGEPFEIDMQGLGLFACRRDAWPGLNSQFRGFGGEEGYLHEKVRQQGGRVLCHPALRWAHRFERPAGAPYPNRLPDRVRNYVIGWNEIGWDDGSVRDHFRSLPGDPEALAILVQTAVEQAEHPLGVFDAVFCVAPEHGRCAARRLSEHPGVGWRVECVPSWVRGSSAAARHRSWTWLLDAARRRGYRHVLVLDGEASPGRHTEDVPDLRDRDWDLCCFDVDSTTQAIGVAAAAAAALRTALGDDTTRFFSQYEDVDDLLSSWTGPVIGTPRAARRDRPSQVNGLSIEWLSDGLLVTRPDRLDRLNPTAAFLFESCDGNSSETQLAAAARAAFGLEELPLDDVAVAVAEMRAAGLLERPKGENHWDRPFDVFDAIFCLNLDTETTRWAAQQRAYERLGISGRVERRSAIATPENPHRGCALSWRAAIAEASERGCAAVLVFEDDCVFLDDTVEVLRRAVPGLADRPWDLCYLGAAVWGQQFPPVHGTTLQRCGPVTCTHALAISRRAYDRILRDVPDDAAAEFDAWLSDVKAFDQYLMHEVHRGRFDAVILNPRVASQPALLLHDDADAALAHRYTEQ